MAGVWRNAGWSLVLLVLLVAAPAHPEPAGTITFPSADGLPLTADLYAPHKGLHTAMVVLFHQAGWSRGEYLEIAPRLNDLGFNCLAVDLRSGRGKSTGSGTKRRPGQGRPGRPPATVTPCRMSRRH